jgi:hypothetical protein
VRLAGVIFLASLAFSACVSIAQERPTFLGHLIIANDYVRVAKITMLPGSTFRVPQGTDAHILIATSAPTLRDATDFAADASHAEPNTARALMLEANRAHVLSNDPKSRFEGLLLDLQKDPGKISCTETKDCPWSIRSALDPWPIILAEHVTVFRIALPWTPEPRSLIVPESDVTTASERHASGDPLWLLAPTGLTSADTSPSSAAPMNALVTGSFPAPDYFIEVAFYDKPFCFCKRVRENRDR